MDKPFNRRDIGYTIISRLEESLRGFVTDKLTALFGAKYLDGIPEGIKTKILEKTLESDWKDPMQFMEETDFPDLTEIICYKDHYQKYLSSAGLSIKDFQNIMTELYAIRCKIAHIRGYFTVTDLDMVYLHSKNISNYLESFGREFSDFLQILNEQPEKVIIPVPSDFIKHRFSH